MNEEKKGWKLKKKRNNKNEWKKKWQPKLKFADQNFHNQEPRKPAIYNRTSAKHDIWAQASMSLSLFFVISTFNHVLSRHDLHPFFMSSDTSKSFSFTCWRFEAYPSNPLPLQRNTQHNIDALATIMECGWAWKEGKV